MPRLWWVGFACLTVALLVGCQDAPPPGEIADAGNSGNPGEETTVAKTPGQGIVKPALPIQENVDSFDGNWVLTPNFSGQNVHFWLFRLTPGENGDWTVNSLATAEIPGQNGPVSVNLEAGKVEIDGSKIKLSARMVNPKAQIKEALVDFEGELRDGIVAGNLFLADTGVLAPTRLLPTDAETLSDYAEATISEGAAEFQKAGSEPDPARGILSVAKSRPASPASLDAYNLVFKGIVQWNLTEAEVKDAVANYQTTLDRWGPRLRGFAEINAGQELAQARKHIDLAQELLDSGEKQLGDSKLGIPALNSGRLNLRIARAVLTISGKDAEAAAKAFDDTKELLTTQPFHPELLWAAAEYTEKQEKIDDAITYYRTIVAMPLLERMALASRLGLLPGDPTPRSSLIKLWTKQHGSEEGLKEAVFETYDQQLAELFGKIREKAPELPAADAGNRVVLMEVFTGTACEACVAADLAADILRGSLPTSELVVLNYHNHVPAPDPLVNGDSEERATSYQAQGTPMVFVNGVNIPNVGGYFLPEMIESSYRQLLPAFDHFLKTSTDIVITASAEAADGNLSVHVSVEGVPEEQLADVRLRLALAEENVEFSAPNGIRRHGMVVRTMLGGPKGISAKQGKLKFSLPMPLAEIKLRQLGYLHSYEQGKRMQFPKKPVELKPLHLVAFVQRVGNGVDQQGKPVLMQGEILQAVQVPVTGELVYPEFDLNPTPGTPSGDADRKPAETKDDPPPPKATEEKPASKKETDSE